MEIEPLLSRLASLAPSFGRAREDIDAMVSRGRGGDFKGVMQNCRLVLEAVLRALVSDELKQTPGKAMLDELISKFRQQANSHLIPTNILAHMGTVQAWGNLTSHDHATKLSDDSVKVGKLEVLASLNSMVAILEWYAARFGRAPEAVVPASIPAVAPKRGHAIAAGVGLLLAGAGGFYVTQRPAASASFAALDRLYAGWNEPLPPPGCRSAAEASLLGTKASDLATLEGLPSTRSAEAWYLIARARLEQNQSATEAATRALACAGFAAAFNLAGKIAIRELRLTDARPSLEVALEAAPDFHNARYNLALLDMAENRGDDAIKELKRITAADPGAADAHFYLGNLYAKRGLDADAKAEFCAAFDHGKAEAKDRCGR